MKLKFSYWNGESVVSAEENDRAVESRSEIEGAMRVSLWSGSLSEIAYDHTVLSGSFERVGGPGRLRELRGEGRGDSHVAQFTRTVVHRHLAPRSDVIHVTVALVTRLLKLNIQILSGNWLLDSFLFMFLNEKNPICFTEILHLRAYRETIMER